MALAKEFEREEVEMNQAAYYLMKCLIFCSEVMKCLVEDREEESLMQCIEKAYDNSLRSYQNKLPNWLFHVLLKTCRSKSEVIDSITFEDNSSAEDTKKDLGSLAEVIAHTVGILKEHFETRWHGVDRYFL
ncbi:unnamed protein product [Nezara viridula]|uniref:Glycolipid transfer protein domain-containing protein n=1 Tax=Nezara viridula TaxID=85310 RepID=A0A9P0HLT7_NEZVI|nr:unnamed protein product [Nezara viridula]